MPDAVCAIRGGPGSYQTRLAGLKYAEGNGVAVHFLSVVDPVTYEPLHEGEQHAIRAEMAWRDLALAKTIAARAGLDDVRYTVAAKVGGLVETIAGYAKEMGATSILVGSPRSSADAHACRRRNRAVRRRAAPECRCRRGCGEPGWPGAPDGLIDYSRCVKSDSLCESHRPRARSHPVRHIAILIVEQPFEDCGKLIGEGGLVTPR